MSPYQYMSVSSIQLETRLVRPGNVFPVINRPMSVLTVLGESRRWSRSCMIFFRPQRCHRFDVLPDSRYPRYTREMVVGENPNSVATSEMLWPISRAPPITPRSNSLKS
ncbi:uncharacterized protein TNCV_848341 [Trichonephila clavipes]|uniref:Uncharacterized protein n=1 Tax=Trichonephila clavipes TaxID=2585209 RepID=A0A8X6RHR9_TRICX|nr:uncharacterized protein TNCV_848341 [Trichonephila clavipes]